MSDQPSFPEGFPVPEKGLEEVAAAEPQDLAAALAFALLRVSPGSDKGSQRPGLFVAAKAWLRERGRPFAQGWQMPSPSGAGLIVVAVADERQVIWALEEALKSGAVGGAVAALSAPDFVATRRLAFAARSGGAAAAILRTTRADGLSAAWRRWRIGSLASVPQAFDVRAPGPARLRAELTRRRDGLPGVWELEWDDDRRIWRDAKSGPAATQQARGLRLAAGLAGHGLDPFGPGSEDPSSEGPRQVG